MSYSSLVLKPFVPFLKQEACLEGSIPLHSIQHTLLLRVSSAQTFFESISSPFPFSASLHIAVRKGCVCIGKERVWKLDSQLSKRLWGKKVGSQANKNRLTCSHPLIWMIWKLVVLTLLPKYLHRRSRGRECRSPCFFCFV